MFTAVVYVKKCIRLVVFYTSRRLFVFTTSADREVSGRVKKRWKVAGHSMRIHEIDIAPPLWPML